ncbi:MAG: FAD-binding protein, partial [Candidatus Methanosuratus sp.]|nr:FAD-binding protein [Candidatus Methanosuratincola sp.]
DQEFGRPGPQPIDSPPYYAVELCPQATYSIGGLKHNAKGQTVGKGDQPIPRLYSAGDVGQVGHIKPDGVFGALTWGRVAGLNAATETAWE